MSLSHRRTSLRHDTAAARKVAGVDPSAYWDFTPGQAVRTKEGFLGKVQEVIDGPVGGSEIYVVALDDGLGGGEYGVSEITAVASAIAATAERSAWKGNMLCGNCGKEQSMDGEGGPCEGCASRREAVEAAGLHIASDDYPELAGILVERPPLEDAIPVVASKVTGSWEVIDADGTVVYGPTDNVWDAKDHAGPGQDVQEAARQDAYDGWATGADIGGDEYPMANFSTTAVTIGRTAGVLDDVAERINNHLPDGIKDDFGGAWSYDWCRFRRNEHCFYPEHLDYEATRKEGYAIWVPHDRGICPRAKWDDQRACPIGEPGPKSGQANSLVDATIPYEQGGQRQSSLSQPEALLIEAAKDPEFGFHFTSSWKDVQAKAKRIRSEGGVRILSVTGSYISAEVKGDSAVYQSTLMRQPGMKAIALWECGCAWAQYSWGRSGRWKRYEGRMCSHALALNYEASAQEWMGGTIHEDVNSPDWSRGVKPQTGHPGKPPAWLTGPPRRATVHQAMPPIDANPTIEEIVAWYQNFAKAEEPKVTRDLSQLAEHNGGKLEGLDFRFKSPDSMERKIRDKHILDTTDPRTGLSDSLRYTMVFHPADYSAQVQDVLYGLQEKGYTVRGDENSWAPGDSYSGLHYDIHTPDGLRVELQFHTQDSYDLKNKTLHKLYEEFRLPSTPIQRRQELFDTMTAYWNQIEIPDDVLEYPVEKRYMRPVATSGDLSLSLEAAITQAYLGQGVMGRVHGEVVQILSLLPDGFVKVQGNETVPADEVYHPRWDPRAGLDFRASLHQAGPDDGTEWAKDSLDVVDELAVWPDVQGHPERIGAIAAVEADMEGCMIALRPPESVCQALAIDGGEDVSNLHVTVAYLGKASDLDLDRLRSVVTAFAYGAEPLAGRVGGIGTFHNDDANVRVALMDIPGLDAWRSRLIDYLSDAGFEVPGDHGYTPHLTLAYQSDDGPPWEEVEATASTVPEAASGTLSFNDFALACGPDWEWFDMAGLAAVSVAQEAILHDEPEPALPTAEGADDPVDAMVRHALVMNGEAPAPVTAGLDWLMQGSPSSSQDASDIAAAAAQFLATGQKPGGIQAQAGKRFSPAEQMDIINEGDGVTAANLHRLDIAGTHYEALEAALEDDSLW